MWGWEAWLKIKLSNHVRDPSQNINEFWNSTCTSLNSTLERKHFLCDLSKIQWIHMKVYYSWNLKYLYLKYHQGQRIGVIGMIDSFLTASLILWQVIFNKYTKIYLNVTLLFTKIHIFIINFCCNIYIHKSKSYTGNC